MKNVKRPLLIVLIFCSVLSMVCLARIARSKTKLKRPTSFELLDKYAETQNKLKSFILKAKTSRRGKTSTRAMGKFSGEYFYEYELRFDGKRASVRRNIWGRPNSRLNLTKDEALYKSGLWDGKTSFRYNRAANDKRAPLGELSITRIKEENNKRKEFEGCDRQSPGNASRGYFPGDTDRIDTILRKANTISVRDEMENIGGADCYVVEADTKRGKYTVWIDPSHGYHITKATAKRGPGNVVAPLNFTLRPTEKMSFSMENVRFKKVDDVWVPVEADLAYGRKYPGVNFFDNNKIHHKVIHVILNPDHDALGSFIPDDIPDGARVYLNNFNLKARKGKYTWQGGQVVNEKGRVVFDSKSKKASRR